MARWKFVVIAAPCIVGTIFVDVIAKLGYLGDSSAVFDVFANIALLVPAGWAMYKAGQADEQDDLASADDDY
jgi:hypothetical protein